MAPTQIEEMDQMEKQKRQAMAEFRRAQSSKRALHALLSISISFLLLLFFSALLPCLLHHADLHFSLFLINLPDCCWVDRKTMFLLCNLILVVIFRDSGLLASFMPERDPCHELSVSREGHWSSKSDLPLLNSAASSSCSTLQVLANGNKSDEEVLEEEEEEEEANEEEDWCPDMDELNKRLDDFIEKVKRDGKLEALQKVLV